MSNAYLLAQNSVTPPPEVATSYVTDVKDNTILGPGHAIPASNILNVLGRESSQNNVNGIRTDADPESGDFLYVELTNRMTGTTTTTGGATATLITLPLGATPGVYTFDILISGYAGSGIGSPLGCGYTIVGSARTTGAAATLIPTQVVDHFEEGALGVAPQATAAITVSGNSVLVRVTGKSDGVAGFLINWTGTLTYNFAS